MDRCRNVLEKLGENTTDNIGENPRSLPIGEIPEQLKPFLSDAHYRRLDIEIEPAKATLFVPANTLLQSLAVLVKNACEADDQNQRIHLHVRLSDGKFLASVQDHGSGMTPDVSTRAGEPFFTTKETGKGMGLGLFLVRMFAERMRGALRVESRPGYGSTVTLEFPANA